MENTSVARKIQHIKDRLDDQVQTQDDIAQFEAALLAELLELGKLLTEDFIEKKRVSSRAVPRSDRTSNGSITKANAPSPIFRSSA